MSLLHVQNLAQSYGKRQILSSINFRVNAGSLVAFLGPNGAGKTTLFRTIAGLEPLAISGSDEGVFFKGESITPWTVSRRVQQGLIYLPQHSSLFVDMTVLQNLKLIYQHHDYWCIKDGGHKHEPFERFEKEIHYWLGKLNVDDVLPCYAGELSGGQKRKIEVVRALLMHPSLLLMDEPFAGVDPKSIYELKASFVELVKQGLTLLISDHHVDQLLSIADYIFVVINGKIVVEGDVNTIMQHEYTKTMYLGGEFFSELSRRLLKRE